MFERDKKTLRAAGLALDVVRDGDPRRTVSTPAPTPSPSHLTAAELAALGAAGAAMLTDPSFPLADDLRYALAKVTPATDGGTAPAVRREDSPTRRPSARARSRRASRPPWSPQVRHVRATRT